MRVCLFVLTLSFIPLLTLAQDALFEYWPEAVKGSFIQSGWRLEELDHAVYAEDVTTIRYMAINSPSTSILIMDSKKRTVMSFSGLQEAGSVRIDAKVMQPGTYSYVLIINSRMIIKRKLEVLQGSSFALKR